MPNRFTVAPGDHKFTYPADPISLRMIQDAGGLSKMTEEDRAKIKFKSVVAGDDCSDMPKSSLEVYLSRGWVVDSDAPVEVPAKLPVEVPVKPLVEIPVELTEILTEGGEI